MPLQLNILEGHSVDEMVGEVVEVTDIAMVWGTFGTDQMTKDALDFVGMPVYGSPNAQYPTLQVNSRAASIVGVAVRVELKYSRDRETFRLQVGASTVQENTAVDKNGVEIILEHADHLDQGGEVPALFPQVVLSFEEQQISPAIGTLAQAFVGTTNDAPWQGGLAGEWLCTRIEGITTDLVNYTVTHDFQKKEGGWDPEVVMIDPETQKPVLDLAGNPDAIKIVLIYDEVDFTALFPA